MNELKRAGLQRFLEKSKECLLIFDRECRIVFCSAHFERISGKNSDSLQGKNIFDAFPSLRDTGEANFFHQTLAGQESVSRNPHFHAKGADKNIFLEAHYFPTYSGQPTHRPQVSGGIVIVRDVTQERLATEIQRETEARFQKMADHSPVMLWMAGTNSLCNFFNQTWLEFTGRTLAEEWGVGWADGVHPEDFQRCMDTYVENFNARRAFEMEYRLRRKDGQFRWLLDRGVPRYTPDGIFTGYIGSCVDITERKQIVSNLEEAVKVREEFLSIASHELKTPLTSLSLQLGMVNHLLKGDMELGALLDRMKSITEISRRQLGKLSELIEDLLDVSRVSAGRLAFAPEEMDLVPLLEEVVERLRSQAKTSDTPLKLRVSVPSIRGIWDRSRLEQVLTNLLTNALKYAPGKPIAVEAELHGTQAVLEVKDQGQGIPDDQKEKIFEKFHRVSAAKSQSGLGLGLYIVRQIVEGHEGKISVESEPGNGAKFRIELPGAFRPIYS